MRLRCFAAQPRMMLVHAPRGHGSANAPRGSAIFDEETSKF